MKLFLPKKVILTKGIGRGISQVNAFDNALLDAGIANYNLIRVSSIVPPKAKIFYLKDLKSKSISLPLGSLLPVVYAACFSQKKGERISAVLSLGIPKKQDYKKINGLIFEFSSNLEEDQAKEQCEKMLEQGFEQRGV